MKNIVLSLLLIFMLVSFLFAGVDVLNQPVEITESYTEVVITFEYTFIDSTDAIHTRPIFIGDCNDEDGYISIIQSATGDVNTIYHFTGCDNIMENTAIWTTSTPADLDAASSTAKFDTLGIEQGVDVIAFHNMKWLVIEVVGGGSTNQDGNVFTMIVNLHKDQDLVTGNGQPIRVCKTASYSYTAP